MGPKKYGQALLIVDRAMEQVKQHGVVEPIRDRGFARRVKAGAFGIFYTNPEMAECDEYHHLDLYADGRGKVLNVRWKDNEVAEVITFKRGSWEEYFLS